MEKLQAALARAREKRESEEGVAGGVQRGPKPTNRTKLREDAAREAVANEWEALPTAETNDRRLQQWRIFSVSAGQQAQAFDTLRTKTLLEMRQKGWTRVGVTSATPGCGKTTVACNLIAGMSRQPDARAILLDFDLRRPSVGKFLGLEPPNSISDLLSGATDFAYQALRISDNAAVSAATGPVADPASVVSRSVVPEVLDDIQARYRPDIMIFDTPPVLVSDEARATLKLVDCTLIVVQAGQSTLAQIDEAEREVAQYSNVLGVVLNKMEYAEANYAYDY